MKSTIIRNVMTVLLALFSLHVSAQTFSYNGLKYNLNRNTVKVIGKDPNSFVINTNVTIPSSIEYGGKQYSVTSIGDQAFNGSDLTSVTIGNNVTSIGQEAFKGCSGLTSVNIGDNVTSIGQSAFYGCSELTSVNIPNSVKYIEEATFSGCIYSLITNHNLL